MGSRSLLSRGLGAGGLGRDDPLALGKTGRLQRGTHDDLTTLGSRHGAADEEQVTLGVDLDDLEVFRGATGNTHVARHALALEHAAHLKQLELTNVLIVVEALDEKLFLAARNLPHVEVLPVTALNPLALASCDKVLMTVGAVKLIEERLQ